MGIFNIIQSMQLSLVIIVTIISTVPQESTDTIKPRCFDVGDSYGLILNSEKTKSKIFFYSFLDIISKWNGYWNYNVIPQPV